MKVQSIPAQITTVEDKIAGNLNLTQIFLLMVPVFWFMIVYALFIPSMHFAWYKLPIILIITIPSLILSLRIKDKVVISWLAILFRYNTRAKYYLFNKNDSSMRTMDLMSFKKTKRKVQAKSHAKEFNNASNRNHSLGDVIKLEALLSNPKYSFSIKSAKKGDLYVAFEQNKK